jgi:glycosyltransferase involved in cell wall biosynthesis
VYPVLLDVSRLIWRRWSGRLPTGIDRVCLAYLRHFGPRSLAVVQYRQLRATLGLRESARLFELLSEPASAFRGRLLRLLCGALTRPDPEIRGRIYINVGHTGLNSASLGPWLSRHRLKPVFFVHDLIPITHSQYCRPGEKERHRVRMANALDAAAGLITNSAVTQRDVRQFALQSGLPMPPSVVAWLGLEDLAPPGPRAPPARPYFLMIGTIEARKNHIQILRAWQDIVARHGNSAPDLVIVGQRGWQAQAAIGLLDLPEAFKGHVHELGRCDDKALARLISGARAVLMPSHVEGFGLPVAEALQHGTPVIASNLDVFREIAGNIPLYVEPDDRAGWIAAVESYMTDCPDRLEQLERARQFRPPGWDAHFTAVESLLASLEQS